MRLQAKFVDEHAHVGVAARDELGAAIDDEVPVAFAAHAAAGDIVALEQGDKKSLLLQGVGSGEPSDATTDDDDAPVRHTRILAAFMC